MTVLAAAPWAQGCFSSTSAQPARLGLAAPALASALMALNTSAKYFEQAAGRWTHGGFAPLAWLGLLAVLAAIGLSLWVGRQQMDGAQ